MNFNDWLSTFKSKQEPGQEEPKKEVVISIEKEVVAPEEKQEEPAGKEDAAKAMEEFKKGLIDLVKELENKLEKIHD